MGLTHRIESESIILNLESVTSGKLFQNFKVQHTEIRKLMY